MTNILFIASFPIDPEKGGVQRVTHKLTEEFLSRDVNVIYLSLESRNTAYKFNTEQFILPNTKKLWVKENIQYAQNLIETKNITVIINQTGVYRSKLNFIVKIKPKHCKLITVHHNCLICLNKNYRNIRLGNVSNKHFFNYIDFPFVWTILKKLNKKKQAGLFQNAIEKSDKLVLLSERFIPELSYYLKNYNADKVTGIPNPASFDEKENIVFGEKENRILYVGRLRKNQKRVDKLLEIWKIIHTNYPNWSFDVVGDGPDKKWMQEFCQANDMYQVNFHGFSNPKPFLKKAKLFTMTSDFEGFGMVLVEAQSFGVVPIAFNCFSALSDIIEDGESGIIVKKNDIHSYIKRIDNVIKNSEELQLMSTKAQIAPKKYKVSNIVDKWIQLIEELNA